MTGACVGLSLSGVGVEKVRRTEDGRSDNHADGPANLRDTVKPAPIAPLVGVALGWAPTLAWNVARSLVRSCRGSTAV